MERRELEEPGLFLHALEGPAAIRAKVLAFAVALFIRMTNLRLREIRFLWHAIPAVIATLIEIAAFSHALPEILHGFRLTWLRRTNKIIVRDL